VEVDRNGLEVLDRAECLRLLGLVTLGRIGYTSGALPAVLPVTFHLAGERILVQAGRDSRLAAALENSVVAFEIDDFDSADLSGWSVAVTGVATEVSDPVELATGRLRPPARWAPDGGVVLAISTELMSGRRIAAHPPRITR